MLAWITLSRYSAGDGNGLIGFAGSSYVLNPLRRVRAFKSPSALASWMLLAGARRVDEGRSAPTIAVSTGSSSSLPLWLVVSASCARLRSCLTVSVRWICSRLSRSRVGYQMHGHQQCTPTSNISSGLRRDFSLFPAAYERKVRSEISIAARMVA